MGGAGEIVRLPEEVEGQAANGDEGVPGPP